MEKGQNVLVDGSLRDADWYQKYFLRLRQERPHIRIGIIHVTAPRQAVLDRAGQRAHATGRIVPRETLEQTLTQVPRSVEILRPLSDFCVELYNAPDTEDVELRTEGLTWESFRKTWAQHCAERSTDPYGPATCPQSIPIQRNKL
mmetsp:Transcript_32673/g.75195  ORF Transcript_32673/g.75195 Transcript_32673/m.75195 type:complete len:145 (-) Transcript_32673:3305-3739(-)